MRRYGSLDSLIPLLRQLILAELIVRHPGPLYRGELAKRIGVPPSSLLRPLKAMARGGILLATKRGREVYYEPNQECPLLPELRSLLLKSRGLLDVIRGALAPHARSIAVAFVYGSFASSTETPTSDVDLLVVGDLTLLQLTPALHGAERTLGRPVNAVLLSASDLREKISSRNHFYRSVLDKPKLFVVGTEDELGEIVGRKPRGAIPDEHGGASRTSRRRRTKSRGRPG